jgi:hypothetical protein
LMLAEIDVSAFHGVYLYTLDRYGVNGSASP